METVPPALQTIIRPLRVLLLLAAMATLTAGCKSTPKSPTLRCAGVVIRNCSDEQIRDKVTKVFKDHGFETARPEADELVFQRPGTAWETFVRGDWYSGAVWQRVRVYQRPLEPGQTLVDCDLFYVQEHEDPLFQKEVKARGKNSNCQKLLDEVARGLNGN